MDIDEIKLIENKCEECGAVFYSKGKLKVILCPECKKKHNLKMKTIAVLAVRLSRRGDRYVPNAKKTERRLYMDWKKVCRDDLFDFEKRKAGLDNAKEQLRILEDEFISIKGSSGTAPVMGGASKQEDYMLNNIVKRDKIEQSINATSAHIKVIEKALGSLSAEDNYILDCFYIHRTSDYKDRLCDRFCVEEAQIYRMADRALRNFTLCVDGITEI